MKSALRRRLGQLVGTPFGRALLACLALAGWALWAGGILDGPVARQVRTSSVYAAPGVELDVAAARRIIGNRRLVVLFMAPGDDLRSACAQAERAAKGTVRLSLSRAGEGWDRWACSDFDPDDAKSIGRAMARETTIPQGIDAFADRPLEALKVVTLNYDLMVKAGVIPDGARTISPSLPRYVLAAAAVGGVGAGAAALWLAGRRAGRLAAARQARHDERADGRSELSAAVAVLARQIVDLDQRYGRIGGGRDRRTYLRLASDYTGLLDKVAGVGDADEAGVRGLRDRVDELSRQASTLADKPRPSDRRRRARAGR
ncbi:hypothetical protein [Micromonospora eburnea]|uniref:Uncharacterized protein n=1 Tax=Micromonospora eburnea TaxID=227316 RepID=A0A1C6UST9_9ACTN|nr:hypothetical protein [Micromonospora eburnea]SCL56859.1 hypothetical protein GA0070604_3500 [Micromonospora eburnea]